MRPIHTNRYIYHVSLQKHRTSIQREGLKLNSNKTLEFTDALFANNSDKVALWFPFCLDSWDYIFDDVEKYWNNIVPTYDVWKIDTRKISNIWYNDERVGIVPYGVHLITFEAIGPQALTLHRVSAEEKIVVVRNEGCAHVSVFGGLNAHGLLPGRKAS
jgi:hypothetical protein